LIRFLRSLDLTARTWALVVVAALWVVGSASALAVTVEDVTQHNGLSTSDAEHLRVFVNHRSASLVRAAKLVTEAGAAPLLALMAVAVAVLLWWRGARVIVAVAPAIALGFAGAVAAVAKQVVGRPRPPAMLRLVSETEPSFPSGHATDSTAFYLALALILALFVLRRPLARVLVVAAGLAVPFSIGLSRLVLGVHWPSDVLAGWALGTTVALVVVMGVSLLCRLTPPDDSSAVWRLRIVALMHARRAPGLHAV
jgi:undecaprenyl-diphosphatase